MTATTPRLRMFAGPNGSGKSTIKSVISPHLLGVYINADEIEQTIRKFDFLDLSAYGLESTSTEILLFFADSNLLRRADLLDEAAALRFSDNKLIFQDVAINSYFASVAADFMRRALLAAGVSFTFETVMSFPDKIAFLQEAKSVGFRTYLYYVATEDPFINISRVENRVKRGGHAVPKDKIVQRYYRSLDLLFEAICQTNRAYIFDNSGHGNVWLAKITEGELLKMKSKTMPMWFKSAVWDKFTGFRDETNDAE